MSFEIKLHNVVALRIIIIKSAIKVLTLNSWFFILIWKIIYIINSMDGLWRRKNN